MPASPRTTLLCRYHYDPLDRQADCAPVEQAAIQRFYCKSRLATEVQGAVQRSIVQHEDQLLAQRHCEGLKVDTSLLATDQQRSVLHALEVTSPRAFAYTPYGHRPLNGLLGLLGFNGERPDPVTGHYHLGNGYRQFNPVLMRFNSPDSWSPFGEGGVNAYAYCGGDPVNRADPTGHVPITKAMDSFLKSLVTGVPKKPRSPNKVRNPHQRLLNKNRKERERRAHLKGLSGAIKQNEATLPTQNKYSISNKITDLKVSTKLYEKAKYGYGFDKYPTPTEKYTFTDHEGNLLLDVTHFDITKSHFRIMAGKKVISGDYSPVWHLEILRAKYIKNFTNINLMSIRQ